MQSELEQKKGADYHLLPLDSYPAWLLIDIERWIQFLLVWLMDDLLYVSVSHRPQQSFCNPSCKLAWRVLE